MVFKINSNNIVTYDLSDLSTGHDEVVYDGTSWNLNKDECQQYVGDGYLIFGPNVSLKRGTYTLVLNYASSEIQKGVVEADRGVIETADYFLLSNNKNEVRYDFNANSQVEGFRFRLKEYTGGNFSLTGMTLIKNTHDIRKGIFLWILLCVIVNLCIYSKKFSRNIGVIAILIAIGFLVSLPLFSKGIMTGNDLRFHLARIEAIADGIKSGDIPVKMYSVFNDGYGYPCGILYGDAFLYIPALLRLIGFSVIESYKIYIFFINILTSAVSYYCGRKIFDKEKTAIFFSLVYTACSYRLLCIYARAAVGEYTANCFYPIIMLAIWNIYTKEITDKDYKKNSLLLGLGMTGIIYSHVLSTEMVVISLVIFALSLYKKTFRLQTIIVYLKSIVICALTSVAFVVPFIDYYMNVDTMLDSDEFKSTYIQDAGVYINEYFSFFKTITGADHTYNRGLHTPGLVLMLGLVVGFYLILIKKADKKIKVAFAGALVALFVASSSFPWNCLYEIPKLGRILVSVQFPYRYIGIADCFLAVLLGLGLERLIDIKKLDWKHLYYISGLCLMMTFIFVSKYKDEQYLMAVLRTYDTADLFTWNRASDFGMYMGYEYLLDGTNVSKEALDYGVYGDNIKATILSEDGLKMSVYVKAKEDARLEVPRFAYPYFEAQNNKGNDLEVVRGHNNKVTVLFEKPYSGEVYIDFKEPWYWRMAEILSLLSFIGVSIYCITTRKA